MKHKKVLMLASVASMIDQFNLPNIRLLLEMGCEVHVACNFTEGNTCDSMQIHRLQKRLRDMHVVQHQWDCPRGILFPKQCCLAYRQLWRLTGRYQFDWMHCHSPVGGALARLVAHWRGIRVIYTAHGFHFYKGAPLKNWLLYYPVEKALAYDTDVLITVNQEDQRLADRRLRAGQIFRIPGVGIDTERFQYPGKADRREFCRLYQIPEDAVILLSVGELNEGKNHRMVIAALADLPDYNLYYMICGQGDLREELWRYADKMGVGTRIRMPGFLDNLTWVYQSADIFVFPSVREGMPAALIEAMAAGLPCVVSDIRGCRELICEEASDIRGCREWSCEEADRTGLSAKRSPGGFRFSLRRPEQLTAALKMLADHETFRQECGTYNQHKARQYDQSIVQEKMRTIYTEMGSKAEHEKCRKSQIP